MIMKNLLKITIIVITISASIDAKAAVDINALNGSLEKIRTADFGQARQEFDKITEIIRQAEAADKNKIEKQLNDFLKSKSSFASKQFVCEQLSLIGTEVSVSALGPMLLDANTCDMARYALERIHGEKVDRVLRESLDKADVNLKAGIINTIGFRGDKESTVILTKLITDNNQMVATAAISALGKIDDPCATAAIAKAKEQIKGQLRGQIVEAYLTCAERLTAKGQNEKALEIYRELISPGEPAHIRTAAVRGMIIASGDKAGKQLIEFIKSGDKNIQTAAITAIKYAAEANTIKTISEQLPNLGTQQQIQLLTALGECKERAALPAVLLAVKSSDEEVRIAALNTMGELGDASTLDILVQIATTASGSEQKAAQEALYRLRGTEVDREILKRLLQAETKIKIELIRCCDQRNIPNAASLLIKAAKDTNETVRIESIKALRNLADESNLENLIELQMTATGIERSELEKTVIAAAKTIPSDKNPAAKILNALSSAKELDVRCSLLSVLGKIGDVAALPVLKEALADANNKIRDAAIRALSDWPTSEPIDELLKVARETENPTHKVLALRGYIRLVGLENNRADEQTIKMYRQAMMLAPSGTEKKMVLAGLSNMKSVEALQMAAEYLGSDELNQEAESAVIKIAGWTIRSNPQQTAPLLKKIVSETTNEQVQERAKLILQRGR